MTARANRTLLSVHAQDEPKSKSDISLSIMELHPMIHHLDMVVVGGSIPLAPTIILCCSDKSLGLFRGAEFYRSGETLGKQMFVSPVTPPHAGQKHAGDRP